MFHFGAWIHPANTFKLEEFLLEDSFFAIYQFEVAAIHGTLLGSVSHHLQFLELFVCPHVGGIEPFLLASDPNRIRWVPELIYQFHHGGKIRLRLRCLTDLVQPVFWGAFELVGLPLKEDVEAKAS